MASRVIGIHTVSGAVTAVVVGIAANPEGQANARVSMVTIEVGLSSEGRGDRERDVDIDIVNMVV